MYRKIKKPIVAFQMVVNNRRRFLGVSKGKHRVTDCCVDVFVSNILLFLFQAFVGTKNDSSMAKLYLTGLALSEPPFSELTWTTGMD